MTEMDEVTELAPQLDCCAARGLERVRVAASAPANEILENGESSWRRVRSIDQPVLRVHGERKASIGGRELTRLARREGTKEGRESARGLWTVKKFPEGSPPR
jgi:hypothetical protein